jgi:hypothetical protein
MISKTTLAAAAACIFSTGAYSQDGAQPALRRLTGCNAG